MAPAQNGEDFGYIDAKGVWVVPPQYFWVERFSEGMAAVTRFERDEQGVSLPHEYFIDTKGIEVIALKELHSIGPFSEGLAAVREEGRFSGGKVGYLNHRGELDIALQFARGGDFHDGLARVVLDGQCYVQELEGNREAPPSVPAATSCGGISDQITRRCRGGHINHDGKVLFEFDGARDFSDDLAAVEVNGQWGYIDTDGRVVIPLQYAKALNFSEGLAAVQLDGKWGYIDGTGHIKISHKFKEAHPFSDHLARVEGGYIDHTGARVIRSAPGTDFMQGLAHVTLGPARFGYIDHKGHVVFSYEWDKTSRNR